MNNIYLTKDFKISLSGDLVIGSDGDLDYVEGGENIAQDAMVRLRTYLDESPLMPQIGSLISDYAGYPNTRETGEAIEREVIRALTINGYISTDNLYVAVVPVPEDSGKLLLIIDPDTTTENSSSSLEFDIDLTTGELS